MFSIFLSLLGAEVAEVTLMQCREAVVLEVIVPLGTLRHLVVEDQAKLV
tara:strand:- start:399 stop:545 length:147 start_codon:yes stop_codon:yes gene_type:complete